MVLATACAPTQAGIPRAGAYTPNLEDELAGVRGVDMRTDFADSPQSVNDYWTSDRVKDAKPPNLPGPDGDSNGGAAEPPISVVVHPSIGPLGTVSPTANGTSSAGNPWSMAGLSRRTVGRLYFTFDGRNYVCSASVVNSTSGSVVATAAHCLFDTGSKRQWARNVLFVPGDEAGRAPFGRWTAASGHVTQQFLKNAFSSDKGTRGSGWQFDTAFLKMRPQGGKTIQQTLGAQGIAFGEAPEGLMVLGYPTAPPFDGTKMRYCSTPSTRTDSRVYGDYGLTCVMTPGCSGGPWLTRFDPVKGAGYVVSTSSVGNGQRLYGSPMGKTAYDLYLQVDKK
ncbi:trypsin-like serine peptidase [Micromonospora sp. NPDC003197]